MFVVETAPFPYTDPWDASTNYRTAKLRSGKCRFAFLYEAADNSTFRYRVYNTIQVLNKYNDNPACYYFYDEIDELFNNVDKIEILVVCRCRYTHKLAALVNRSREMGKRVIYDIDDFVFNTDYTHLIVDTLAQDLTHPGVWDHWFAYTARLGAAVALTDEHSATNQYLLDRMLDIAPGRGSVVPNFLNDEQIEYSGVIFREKLDRNFKRNEFFDIGYFSGTPSHTNDFAIAKPHLRRFLSDHKNARLFIVGFLQVDDLKTEFGNRIIQYGLHDFMNLQRLISLCEVNIVPLQCNDFTNAKSELKFFDASIVGTVTIASPTYSYSRCIVDNLNGFTAEDNEWYEKIDLVYNNMQEYERIVVSAQTECVDRYYGPKIQSQIMAMINR